MPLNSPAICLLGASGFLGSHTLKQLGADFPGSPVVALMRNASSEKIRQVKQLHPNVEVIEGDLTDIALIEECTMKYPIVINAASSDIPESVRATLVGLTKYSVGHEGSPPLYIHISGMGVTSDNVRGEAVDGKILSDLEFHPKKTTPTNVHLDSDIPITEAGENKDCHIRTAILYPGWIYGIGIGPQKTTFGVRIFRDLFPAAGHAGTWGPGMNRMTSIHVKDCATAISTVLNAMLNGNADEGAEGHYFVLSDTPFFTMRDFTAAFGNVMHEKGELLQGGSRPFPPAVTDTMGPLGWCSLGGNQLGRSDRLRKLGWEPLESRKVSVFESMKKELDIAFLAPPVQEVSPGNSRPALHPQ